MPLAFICGLSVVGTVSFGILQSFSGVALRTVLLAVVCGGLLGFILLKGPSASPGTKPWRVSTALVGGVLGVVLGVTPPVSQVLLFWLYILMGGALSFVL